MSVLLGCGCVCSQFFDCLSLTYFVCTFCLLWTGGRVCAVLRAVLSGLSGTLYSVHQQARLHHHGHLLLPFLQVHSQGLLAIAQVITVCVYLFRLNEVFVFCISGTLMKKIAKRFLLFAHHSETSLTWFVLFLLQKHSSRVCGEPGRYLCADHRQGKSAITFYIYILFVNAMNITRYS